MIIGTIGSKGEADTSGSAGPLYRTALKILFVRDAQPLSR
jgi:hypothetical protein